MSSVVIESERFTTEPAILMDAVRDILAPPFGRQRFGPNGGAKMSRMR